jgi:hypothetical protein
MAADELKMDEESVTAFHRTDTGRARMFREDIPKGDRFP